MRITLCLICVFAAGAVAASGQQPITDPPKVCISQQAANAAATNLRELEASRAEIAVLKSSLDAKGTNEREAKAAADKSIADLKAALNDTQIKLAEKTGELIGSDAEKTRLLAMLQFALQNTKKRKYGLVNIF